MAVVQSNREPRKGIVLGGVEVKAVTWLPLLLMLVTVNMAEAAEVHLHLQLPLVLKVVRLSLEQVAVEVVAKVKALMEEREVLGVVIQQAHRVTAAHLVVMTEQTAVTIYLDAEMAAAEAEAILHRQVEAEMVEFLAEAAEEQVVEPLLNRILRAGTEDVGKLGYGPFR